MPVCVSQGATCQLQTALSLLLKPQFRQACVCQQLELQHGTKTKGRQLSVAVCAVAAAEALQACDVLVRRAAHSYA
jgi:hypothetical protein